MRKDHDISGLELDGLSICQFDDGLAFDHQMVKHKMRSAGSDGSRHYFRSRGRKTPGGREFRAEEHGAVQLDSAQNFRECVYGCLRSMFWTVGKVMWPLRKAIRFREPFEQLLETLGHGYKGELTARL
jgi:hypothetical protein